MTKLFEKPEELEEYIFRITDNGGTSIDRYTVVFSDGDYLGLSSNPSSPVGFSQYGEKIDIEALNTRVESGKEIDIALGDMEPHLVKHIIGRINESWQDFLDDIENMVASAVASKRELAKENEGLFNSAGDGIYWTENGFKIRHDGNETDDLGPYTSGKEALLNTLPSHYSLSGPEYHTTINDLTSMNKTDGVADRIAELEAKINEDCHKPCL